jgi:rhamnosyltransferase
MRVSVVIPTLNPGPQWSIFSAALLENLHDLDLAPSSVLVLDSASTDATVAQSVAAGFRVLPIPRDQFDHGGTRQAGVLQEAHAELLVFLTQDAVLAGPQAIRTLLAAFADPSIAAAYGRQLPRPGAQGIEVHARLFNYPPVSRVRSLKDREILGFRSIFSSNSFCAFRREALVQAGGFPRHAICSEETIAIAHMHLNGWRSAYVAEAQIYHSHAYSMRQEFQRYFDVGVTHARQPFLVQEFGTTGGEGRRFVLSELRYLLRHRPQQLPTAMLRSATKFAAYRLGRREGTLSLTACRRLSMNRSFWNAEIRARQLSAAAPLSNKTPFPTAALSQRPPRMVPQQFQAKSDLRPSAQPAAEVPRVSPVQQQRLRKPDQPAPRPVIHRPNPRVM